MNYWFAYVNCLLHSYKLAAFYEGTQALLLLYNCARLTLTALDIAIKNCNGNEFVQ